MDVPYLPTGNRSSATIPVVHAVLILLVECGLDSVETWPWCPFLLCCTIALSLGIGDPRRSYHLATYQEFPFIELVWVAT